MLHRRDFLQAGALAGCSLGAASFSKPVNAIEPIARNGRPKFKFSLAAYSYRDLLQPKQGKPAQLTLKDFIDDGATFGLEGTELTSYYFPKETTPDYLHALRHQC